MWKCEICRYENPDNTEYCLLCGNPCAKSTPQQPEKDVGRWKCDVCGADNSSNSVRCTFCGTPHNARAAKHSENKPESGWICKECGTENAESFDSCVFCGASRPKAKPQQPEPVPPEPVPPEPKQPERAISGWKCSSCGKENPEDYNFCIACGQPRDGTSKPQPETAAEWKCRDCGNRNPGDSEFCTVCGAPRRPQKKTGTLSMLLIFLISLAVLAAVIFIVARPRLEGNTPISEEEPVTPAQPEPEWPEPVLPRPDIPGSGIPEAGIPIPEDPKPVQPEPETPEPEIPEPVQPEPAKPEEPVTGYPWEFFGNDTESHFTYSGGQKRLVLSFDNSTHDLKYLYAFSGDSQLFCYSFEYDSEGRIRKISRYGSTGNADLVREFSYTDGYISGQDKTRSGKNSEYTRLSEDENYFDSVSLSGHTVEEVCWPLAGYEELGYSLFIWDSSLEKGAYAPEDRLIFEIRFFYDGIADEYNYFWRNEIGVNNAYDQIAGEKHYRDENNRWYHYRTDLSFHEFGSGEYVGYAQRWGDDPEWEYFTFDD